MLSTILIHILGTLLLFCAIQVLRVSHKPVHSILYLVLCFVLVCLFYIFLKLEFLALIYIMVYVGAIAVLFLFVIMMLELKNVIKVNKNFDKWWFFGLLIVGVLLFIVMDLSILQDFGQSKANNVVQTQTEPVMRFELLDTQNRLSDLFLLGFWIFTVYWDVLLLLGFILLIAMVGAIVLVADVQTDVKAQRKFQNEGQQLNKDFFAAIQLKSFKKQK